MKDVKIEKIEVKFGYNADIEITADSDRIYIKMNKCKTLTEYGLESSDGSWLKCSYGEKFILDSVLENYDPTYTCAISTEGNHMFYTVGGKDSIKYLLGNLLKDMINQE